MKKKIYIDMGNRLDKVCRALGLDKKDIAKELGIAPAYLSELCKGSKTNPGILIFKIDGFKYPIS